MTAARIAALPQDDWRKKSPDFNPPRLAANLALVEKLRKVGARHGASPGEVAIAWTLRHPAVTGAIVGARRPEQVDGFIGAASLELSTEDLAQIAS
jgi:aryl-alcohol dehydrogenase-like predicted oxidoreductase